MASQPHPSTLLYIYLSAVPFLSFKDHVGRIQRDKLSMRCD